VAAERSASADCKMQSIEMERTIALMRVSDSADSPSDSIRSTPILGGIFKGSVV